MSAIPVKNEAGLRKFLDALLIPIQAGQGQHVDPELLTEFDGSISSNHNVVHFSEMDVFKGCLTKDGISVRASILDDLSNFYDLPIEECVRRCLHWEELSVKEWKSGDRSSPDGLRDFYNSVQSWSFDLMWYAYLQATGHAYPAAVVAANFSAQEVLGRHHLDFGSGIGVTSQLFARRGYNTTLADISRPLLDFARWRLERHGDPAKYIDLNIDTLPQSAYDCITALDTLVHVPDFEDTALELHRALKPDGLLFANFDVRDRSAESSAWHLYGSAIDLDCRLQACGFAKIKNLGISPTCYRRVEPDTVRHRIRRVSNQVTTPARNLFRLSRRVRWPTPTRAIKLVYRLATGKKLVTNRSFISS